MTESLLAIYCVLIVLASVSGGWLTSIMRMTHLRTQLLMSFVAGLMLGIAMLHMLPHAADRLQSSLRTSAAALTGILAMFILLRAFHSHSPGTADDSASLNPHASSHSHSHLPDQDHRLHHDHGDPIHHHAHLHVHDSSKRLNWLGMFFGLGLHTLMDGVALSASVAAESAHQPWLGLAGLGTFLAVMLHKPLDAFAITSVMKSGGWTPVQQSLVNMSYSMACPIGALLFFFGASQMPAESEFLGWGLALSAGCFICISLSDLLPEVAFHDHDRLKLTAALLLGVALAVAIESLPGHPSHDHGQRNLPDSVESPSAPLRIDGALS